MERDRRDRARWRLLIAWSTEIPGANGRGRRIEECRLNLAAAIQLIHEDRREDGLRGAPPDSLPDTVTLQ